MLLETFRHRFQVPLPNVTAGWCVDCACRSRSVSTGAVPPGSDEPSPGSAYGWSGELSDPSRGHQHVAGPRLIDLIELAVVPQATHRLQKPRDRTGSLHALAPTIPVHLDVSITRRNGANGSGFACSSIDSEINETAQVLTLMDEIVRGSYAAE
uniref:Uncharacterized protein n=1 Tax=Anopheles atroparvus TaxID=41427 RepID=A0A182JHC7_ANOAO